MSLVHNREPKMKEAISILLLFLNCINVSKAKIYKKLNHHSPAPNIFLKCTEMVINHADNLPLQEGPQLLLFFPLGRSSGRVPRPLPPHPPTQTQEAGLSRTSGHSCTGSSMSDS